eukprot:2215-Pyramimonas_sp.AAC.1
MVADFNPPWVCSELRRVARQRRVRDAFALRPLPWLPGGCARHKTHYLLLPGRLPLHVPVGSEPRAVDGESRPLAGGGHDGRRAGGTPRAQAVCGRVVRVVCYFGARGRVVHTALLVASRGDRGGGGAVGVAAVRPHTG